MGFFRPGSAERSTCAVGMGSLLAVLQLLACAAVAWGLTVREAQQAAGEKSTTTATDGDLPPDFIRMSRMSGMLVNQSIPTGDLLPEIENEHCIRGLIGPTSPYTRRRTAKMIPNAYNLLDRWQVLYRAPEIEERFKAPCFRTCAVVGSSGVLKDSQWGREIDEHNAVIRLNNAPTYYHERDVGSKTTIRIMHDVHFNPKNLVEYLRMEPGGLILMWPPLNKGPYMAGPPPNLGGKKAKRFAARNLRQLDAKLLVTRMSLRAYKDSHWMFKNNVGPFPPYVPSTGWNTIYTALHLCRSIDVYGIGWTISEESYRRAGHTSMGRAYYFFKHDKGHVNEHDYYFKRRIRNKKSFHGFDKEKEGMLKLSQLYNITFR